MLDRTDYRRPPDRPPGSVIKLIRWTHTPHEWENETCTVTLRFYTPTHWHITDNGHEHTLSRDEWSFYL